MGWGPGLAKISKTCPDCDITSRNPHRKQNMFFSMSTRRLAESVEGLNSSLALAAGDLWPKKGRPIAVVKGWKKLESFRFRFCVCDVTSGIGFRLFWPRFPHSGCQLPKGIFWLKFLLETSL